MSHLSYKTQFANKQNHKPEWFVIDATNQTVGRMCTRIASVLRGKHKPTYTPHADAGDFVIVINAEKIVFTGNKLDQKTYLTFSGYPGGQKEETAKNLLARRPEQIIERAVKGMLPKNRLGRAMFKKIFVYAGDTHPHGAQKPSPLSLN
ncbi:MAG: 50S ribosomal protein L13 [Bacteroidetes bacterium]|nr:50S ribosomal protein L13 [Bacteroidota bacterium]